METFMSGAMVVQAVLLSFLLALWMTWIALRGLFWLMPVTSSKELALTVQPIEFVPVREHTNGRRNAA